MSAKATLLVTVVICLSFLLPGAPLQAAAPDALGARAHPPALPPDRPAAPAQLPPGVTSDWLSAAQENIVTGLSTAADWTGEGDLAGSQFSVSVGTAGDVNGDGYVDVIVGAPYYYNGERHEGAAFVYLGGATGLSATPAWMADSNQADAQFGVSVGTAGDVNGDGYADVIVGAPYYYNRYNQEGAAFVYLGSATGLSPTPAWTAESDQDYAHLGWSVGVAGDVNGDGHADVIVGAPDYENGQNQDNEGAAFVYHGGGAAGLRRSPAWGARGTGTWPVSASWWGRRAT